MIRLPSLGRLAILALAAPLAAEAQNEGAGGQNRDGGIIATPLEPLSGQFSDPDTGSQATGVNSRAGSIGSDAATPGPSSNQFDGPNTGNQETGADSADVDLGVDVTTLEPLSDRLNDPNTVNQEWAITAEGAVLRGLDRIWGNLGDLELISGTSERFGKLTVTLGECRYPAVNPAGDAYAFVTILADGREQPVFDGWMIASSPALNALDHPRYDIWVLRCMIP